MLADYILTAMLMWIPPAEHWKDAPAVTEWRYARIAEDIALVAEDACASGAGVSENDCAVRTALVLASVASFESHFRRDVDTCAVGGDHMTSWSLYQLAGRKDVCTDRQHATREALRMIRSSMAHCRDLSEYTSGWCGRGVMQARLRWERAVRYYRLYKYEQDVNNPSS